jgi:hypothetical protein
MAQPIPPTFSPNSPCKPNLFRERGEGEDSDPEERGNSDPNFRKEGEREDLDSSESDPSEYPDLNLFMDEGGNSDPGEKENSDPSELDPSEYPDLDLFRKKKERGNSDSYIYLYIL